MLDPTAHHDFRSAAGIAQYITELRFDIAFATKEIMRDASCPNLNSFAKIKRLDRYLKGRPISTLTFEWTWELRP